MRVGPYEVTGELGRGAMGVVHRARRADGTEVALKILVASSATARERFDRERRLLASFTQEDGFVPLLDAGEVQGRPWLVMPLVPGGTLRQRLRKGPLPVDEVIRLGELLAAAVARAHERGVVHRDLKPENVLLDAEARPLIADLGLAKHFEGESVGTSRQVALTETGRLAGTVGYLAPEQARDARSAGPAADVFSLGAILWECLAGRPAFEGGTLIEVLAKLERESPPLVSSVRPDAPAWLAGVVARSLERDARRRFGDAGQLLLALRTRDARAPARRFPLAAATGAAVVLATLLVVARPSSPDQPPRTADPARSQPAARAALDPDVLATIAQATRIEPRVLGALGRAAKWRSANLVDDASPVVSAAMALVDRDARSIFQNGLDDDPARSLERLGVVIDAFDLVRKIDPRVGPTPELTGAAQELAARIPVTTPSLDGREDAFVRAVALSGREVAGDIARRIHDLVPDRKRRVLLLSRIAEAVPDSSGAHHYLGDELDGLDERIGEYEKSLACGPVDPAETYWNTFHIVTGRVLLGRMRPEVGLERLGAVWSSRARAGVASHMLKAYLLLLLERSGEAAAALDGGADELDAAVRRNEAKGGREKVKKEVATLRAWAGRLREPASVRAVVREFEVGLRSIETSEPAAALAR